VLDAAMALFWKQGYAGTGLSELEAATKLGRQSLYGAFGDKRALFGRVVERYFEVVLRPYIIDVLDAPGSARANVERVIRSWDEAAAAPDFNGCLVGNSSSELGLHDPEMAELLRRKLELLEAAFHRALKRAQQAGEIRATLDVRALARSFLVTAQGLSIVCRVNRDRAFVRAVMRDALARLDE
jgi:TetR/AcrR family transcriptional repressor of nem operon